MSTKDKIINFESIIEQTLSGILIIDKDRVISYYNRTALEMLECTSDELHLKKLDEFLHHDYHNACKERVHNIIHNKQIANEMEQKLITTKGNVIDVEIKGVPYYYSSTDISVLILIRDITKQKKAERLLSHKDKLISIGQISAGIAHEIKNPLTSVKGFIQLLKEETNHPYIKPIESELDNALSTLHNLLQVSKPDLLNESTTSLNLCEELDSIIFLFQEQLYKIELIKKYKNQETNIQGKKNILIKCFFNLIKNAVEAIEDKGKVFIEHYVTDGMVNIKVTDTGVGIPEDKIRILGTPFYSTKENGTGMGLTQVFTTIIEHNGQINIESKHGKGTTFHITLPC